ncbi:hypothetical protein [uncultured Corynebacterium sp.]|nr:hypothetical protein [uncultured Corynebacterium sp.]
MIQASADLISGLLYQTGSFIQYLLILGGKTLNGIVGSIGNQ